MPGQRVDQRRLSHVGTAGKSDLRKLRRWQLVLILCTVEEPAFGGEQLAAVFKCRGEVFLILGQDFVPGLVSEAPDLLREVCRMMYHCWAIVRVLFHDQ